MTRDESTASGARIASSVEAVGWLIVSAMALMTLLSTLSSDFPARSQALAGEGIVVAVAAGLLAAALRRASRDDRRGAWPVIAVVLRIVLLGPVLAFLLLVAASGFAA